MKKFFTLIALGAFLIGCTKESFIEGQFTFEVPAEHPILDIWMQGLTEEEKREQEDTVREAMNSQAYVFVKDETYQAYFFAKHSMINLPEDNKIELERNVIDGIEVYSSEKHEISFRFTQNKVMCPEIVGQRIPLF